MAAMIWDTEAQAFTESETPVKYEPTVGAWTDTTGLAWNLEAQAWTERWGTQVSAYVYGAVSETITIKKNGIVVATVQTDASGCSTEMVSLSLGTYEMTGSVSGWTEEQTVDENTTKFRAMPESSLYWYGNKCTWITGGWNNNCEGDSSIVINTNSITLTNGGAGGAAKYDSVNTIDFAKYTSLVVDGHSINQTISNGALLIISVSGNQGTWITTERIFTYDEGRCLKTSPCSNIPSGLLRLYADGGRKCKLYAIWFE